MCPGGDAHPRLNEPRAGTKCGVQGEVEAMVRLKLQDITSENRKHCGGGGSCDDHDNGGDDINDDYFLN